MSNVLGVFLEMVSPSKVLFREMPAIMDAMAMEAHHWHVGMWVKQFHKPSHIPSHHHLAV